MSILIIGGFEGSMFSKGRSYRGFIFIGPALVFLLLIIIYPLLTIFPQSFQEFRNQTFRFVGLVQYKRLLSDELFWLSIRLTIIFTVGTVVLHQVFGWALALLLNARWPNIQLRNVFRAALLLPWIFSAPASALLWRLLYYSRGMLSYISQQLLGFRISFLSDPNWALPAVLVVFTWNFYPLYMLLILGGLQAIPRSMYEAAKVDGANRVQSFWKITLPQMSGILMTMILIDFITTFVQFALVWVMTKGGPLRSTYLVSFYLYEKGLLTSKFGYASALSVIIALIIFVFMFINLRYFRGGSS